MNLNLKLAIDVLLQLFLLGMVIQSAWFHDRFVFMWSGLLIIDTIVDFVKYSNITVVNKIYNINKPQSEQEKTNE